MATATMEKPLTPPKPRPAPVRPSAVSAPPREVPKLQKLDGVFVPPKIILNAVEGWGKTTAGSYAENACMIMAAGETGYETLLGSGRVPSIPAVTIHDWQELLAVTNDISGYSWAVYDAIGSFDYMCNQFVCDRDFKSDWSDSGFMNYQKGYEVAVSEWKRFLSALDRLQERGTAILLLSHAKVKTFQDPLSANYDRYIADINDKKWDITKRWASALLFGNFYSVVESSEKRKPEALRRGKGIGGTERVIYTERRDAFDAKNQYGMPEIIDIPHDPTLVWETIYSNIRKES